MFWPNPEGVRYPAAIIGYYASGIAGSPTLKNAGGHCSAREAVNHDQAVLVDGAEELSIPGWDDVGAERRIGALAGART